MATETTLEFDGWTVNRVSGEMTRAGRSTRLPQQPLRILVELYDHAGAIVTREHLVKALWPSGIVDFDNGLNVAMRKLRVALDDVGDVPQYIETLPKVGYRFIGKPGPVAAADVPAKAAGASRRAYVVGGSAVLVCAVALAAWLAHGSRPAPAPPKHVPSERARELYLYGLSQRSRRDINAAAATLQSFEAALREDPEYPEAWAALADVTSALVNRQELKPAEGVPKAFAAARRAIELDPDLPQGHYSLAEIYLDHERNFAAAHAEFERARQLNDQLARLWHHYALWHGQLGHIDEALADIRRARELEPMTLLYAGRYGLFLYYARRYDEAIAFLRPLVDANPNFDNARSVLARSLMATGDLAGAGEQLARRAHEFGDQSDAGVLAAKRGDRAAAQREIARLEAHGREGYGVAYDIATIYTALGDLDAGCAALGRAVDDHSVPLGWMRLEPRLDPLRARQCFADVAKRVYASEETSAD